MNPNSEHEKYCQLVLADTTLKEAKDKKCSVEMPLLIPQRKRKGSKLESLGGYLSVPLREMRMGQGHTPLVVDKFLGPSAVTRGDEVSLVLDSGSQGFWVLDFTEGEDGQSITAAATLGTLVGDYELVCGKRGGPTFSIRIPQQWRDFQGADQLLSQAPTVVKGQGLQCLIVGNPFLQAMSMTFDVSRMVVALSHLDVDGNRCEAYQGPRSDISKSRSALAATPANLKNTRLPIRDGKLMIPSLAQSSLAMSTPEEDKKPIASDVALDLRFMTYPNAPKNSSLISVETRSSTELILPCLDVVVTNAQGKSVFMSQIFDTGSGVNLLMDVDLSSTEGCPSGECFCENGGLVGDAFGNNALAGASSSRCGTCNDPAAGSKQGGGGGICNTYCCTPEGVSCDNEMPCSVSFCTGVVSYSPKFVKMSFPSENTGSKNVAHLSNVEQVFAGSAQPTCVPGVNTGLFGAWFWDAPLVGDASKKASSKGAGLPYYLLNALGQIGGPNENYTLKFWRSDLKKADTSVKLGEAPLKKNPRVPQKPWWVDAASGTEPPSRPPNGPPPVASPAPAPPSQSPAAPVPAPAFSPTAPPTAPPASAPAFSPPAPQTPFSPPPGFSPHPGHGPMDISEGSAYNQNREGGVQQVVIIETDWGKEEMHRRRGARPHKNYEPSPADGEGNSSRGGNFQEGPPQDILRDPGSPTDDGAPRGFSKTPGDRGGASRDWVLRGLAIAAVSILAVLLLFLIFRSGGRESDRREPSYVMTDDYPQGTSLQT